MPTQTAPLNTEVLKGQPRLLIEAELVPMQGDRFQPTGFADLGAALYTTPDGDRKLLVESAQSVANRLEGACLDGDGPRIAPDLDGLPYVVAKLSGATQAETSSLIEAHRLNSPFIISDPSFQKTFLEASGYTKGQVINWRKAAETLFRFDPNSLIHGIFMANLLDGRMRIARALTGFIEASGVAEARSGGVKNNALDPTGKIRAEGYENKDVYGNVPYPRTEFTAKRIVAYFNVDLSQLRGFRLPEPAHDLLLTLALYKVRAFLDGGLRLRTACDLRLKNPGVIKVTAPVGYELPSGAALLARVQELIKTCSSQKLFAQPAITEISTKTKASVDKKDKAEKDESVE